MTSTTSPSIPKPPEGYDSWIGWACMPRREQDASIFNGELHYLARMADEIDPSQYARAELARLRSDRDEFRRALERDNETIASLHARLAAVEKEAVAVRAKNRELNRRVQSAESGLLKALDPLYTKGGPSLGRALANSAATMYRANLDELVRVVRVYVMAPAQVRGEAYRDILEWLERFDAALGRAK